jgi:multiple sugar transport system substrate-binding protein
MVEAPVGTRAHAVTGPAPAGRPRRRRALAGALAGAAGATSGVLAAACGAGPQSGSSGASGATERGAGATAVVPPERGTLTWLVDSSTEARMGAYDRIRTSFQTANPTLSVDVVADPDAVAKIKTLVAGGQPPDVGAITPVWIAGMAEKGFYQPLDSLVGKDGAFKLDDYVPATVEAGRWKGKLFFLPLFNNFHVLAYNAPRFQQLGVAPPTDQWTWETLREAATKLTTRAGDQTDVFGFTFATDLNNVLPWIWSNGGDAFDRNEDPTRSTMANPKTVEALQFLVDLRQRLRVAPNTADRAGRSLSFEGGTIATTLQGVGGLSTLVERATFDWNVQLVPRGSAGRVNFGGGQLTGIVAGAKLPQSAWALVKHMHGPAGNREMIAAYQGMTPYKPAFAEFLKIAPPPANRQAVVDALGTVRPLPKAVVLEANYAAYTKPLNDMLDGLKSVPETCQDLDRVINGAMAPK